MGCGPSKEPSTAADPSSIGAAKQEEKAADTPPAQPAAEAPAPAAGETPRSAYIAGKLDPEAEKRVTELFKHWDIDGGKKLELAAFTGASMQLGPHESKLLARLADMDLDKDGYITDEVRSRQPAASFTGPRRLQRHWPPAGIPAAWPRSLALRGAGPQPRPSCERATDVAPSARARAPSAGVAQVVHGDGGDAQP